MKFLYEGNSRKSGIYEIVNKITGFFMLVPLSNSKRDGANIVIH